MNNNHILKRIDNTIQAHFALSAADRSLKSMSPIVAVYLNKQDSKQLANFLENRTSDLSSLDVTEYTKIFLQLLPPADGNVQIKVIQGSDSPVSYYECANGFTAFLLPALENYPEDDDSESEFFKNLLKEQHASADFVALPQQSEEVLPVAPPPFRYTPEIKILNAEGGQLAVSMMYDDRDHIYDQIGQRFMGHTAVGKTLSEALATLSTHVKAAEEGNVLFHKREKFSKEEEGMIAAVRDFAYLFRDELHKMSGQDVKHWAREWVRKNRGLWNEISDDLKAAR